MEALTVFLMVMAVLFVIVALVAPDFGMVFPTKSRTAWTSDYPRAYARAERERKPMMLFFGEEWCQPCKMMKRVFKDKSLEGLAESHVLCYLTLSRNRSVAARYGVGASLPTLVEVRSGAPVRRHIGYLNPAEFRRWLYGNE